MSGKGHRHPGWDATEQVPHWSSWVDILALPGPQRGTTIDKKCQLAPLVWVLFNKHYSFVSAVWFFPLKKYQELIYKNKAYTPGGRTHRFLHVTMSRTHTYRNLCTYSKGYSQPPAPWPENHWPSRPGPKWRWARLSKSYHANVQIRKGRACSVAKSCLTLCDPMDCSPPGSSVHKIL